VQKRFDLHHDYAFLIIFK